MKRESYEPTMEQQIWSNIIYEIGKETTYSSQISRKIYSSPDYTTRVINTAIKKGFINKITSISGRANNLTLTSKGRKLWEAIEILKEIGIPFKTMKKAWKDEK